MWPVAGGEPGAPVAAPLVRPAALTDLAAIAELERLCLADPWPPGVLAEEMAQPLGLVLLAEGPHRRPCAYAAFRLGPGEAELMRLAVHPRQQRRGVGSALLREGLLRLRRRGVESCFLEVRATNLPAIRLYEALGFSRVGHRRAYYSDGTHAVLMARRLEPPP